MRRRARTSNESPESTSQTQTRMSVEQAIGGMARALAHELNQPLAAASVYLETARRMSRRPENQRLVAVDDALRLAAEQLARMGEIVNRLREFVAHRDPDRTRQSLHALIRETATGALAEGKTPGVVVRLTLDAKDDNVLIDRNQIGQVLSNLLRNAQEALALRPDPQITISTGESGLGMVRCEVADNGPGIAGEIASDLFEPLKTTKAAGMGIGLSISKSIVEAHDGQIWVDSDPARGAAFSFTLPLSAAEIVE